MATGLGQRFRSNILNYILAGGTSPAVATYYVSLHTADPGDNGTTGNEATGAGYARVAVTAGTGAFNTTTSADPSVLSNLAAITFPLATANWSSLAPMTHWGLYTDPTVATAATFVGRGLLTTSQIIANGNTASFGAGQLTMNITIVTSGSTTGMSRVFRAALYDHLFRAVTAPLTNGTNTSLYVSLHTADPGDTGASEATPGTGAYARAAFARVTSPAFGAAVDGNPSYISNTNTAVSFVQATAPGYAGGSTPITWWALWRTASAGTGADYILRGTMTSQAIVAGNTASFAITGGSAPAGPGRLFTQLDQT